MKAPAVRPRSGRAFTISTRGSAGSSRRSARAPAAMVPNAACGCFRCVCARGELDDELGDKGAPDHVANHLQPWRQPSSELDDEQHRPDDAEEEHRSVEPAYDTRGELPSLAPDGGIGSGIHPSCIPPRKAIRKPRGDSEPGGLNSLR